MSIQAIMQVVLLVASVGLGVFCAVLAQRLRKLNDLEHGLGGAIAVMAAEVDRLERAIRIARDEATKATLGLSEEIATSRKERAMWDLRKQIGEVTQSHPFIEAPQTRRLRKRREKSNA